MLNASRHHRIGHIKTYLKIALLILLKVLNASRHHRIGHSVDAILLVFLDLQSQLRGCSAQELQQEYLLGWGFE